MRRIFISYVEDDIKQATILYELLVQEGFTPWMNKFDLGPGLDWRLEIERQISISDHSILCLSNNSITKVGFVQTEWRLALEEARKHPETYPYILPIRLDDCERPFYLSRYNSTDCFTMEKTLTFIKQLKKDKGTEVKQDLLLIYKDRLKVPDLTGFINELFQKLNSGLYDPLGCLVLCVAVLRNKNLTSSLLDTGVIEKVEKLLPTALEAPQTHSTAILIQAFIMHDFYEKRYRKPKPSSLDLFQEIMNKKLLPDMELIKYLNFSEKFSHIFQQSLKWIKQK